MVFSGIAGLFALGVRIAASYAFAEPFGNMVIGYAEAFSWAVLLVVYLIRQKGETLCQPGLEMEL